MKIVFRLLPLLLVAFTFHLFIKPVYAVSPCSSFGVNLAPTKNVYGDDEKVEIKVTIGGGDLKKTVSPKDGFAIVTYGAKPVAAINGVSEGFGINSDVSEFTIEMSPSALANIGGTSNIGEHTLVLRKVESLASRVLRPSTVLWGIIWPIGTIRDLIDPKADYCEGPKYLVIPSKLKDVTCSFEYPSNVKAGAGFNIPSDKISIPPAPDAYYTALLFPGSKTDFDLGRAMGLQERLGLGTLGVVGAAANLFSFTTDATRKAEENAREYLDFKPETPSLSIKSNIPVSTNGYTLAILVKGSGKFEQLFNSYGFVCAYGHFTVTNDDTTSTLTPTTAGGGAGKEFTEFRNSLPPKEKASSAGTRCDPKTGGLGDGGIMTAIGCVPTNPVAFVEAFFKFSLGIGGGLALLLMSFGAIRMILAQGNPESLKKGQEQFTSALIGLLFIIFSVLLLQVIGVDILNLPGFGK